MIKSHVGRQKHEGNEHTSKLPVVRVEAFYLIVFDALIPCQNKTLSKWIVV